MSSTATDRSLHGDECFVCIVCSHGEKEGIFCHDGGIIKLDELTSYFDATHCAALQNKPKLFFIQACQGSKYWSNITHSSLLDCS